MTAAAADGKHTEETPGKEEEKLHFSGNRGTRGLLSLATPAGRRQP